MHYHLEIIMPPTDDVESAVAAILKPFNEQPQDDDDSGKYGFWDWYVIGGRWAGRKMQERLDQTKLQAFQDELNARNVTVSSFSAGKQELQPATQIPMVDQLWREFFPEVGGPCPLFKHSNDQYKNDSALPDDVCRFSDIPRNLQAERVIIAARDHKDKETEAVFMISEDFWNGVNHVKTTWKETVEDAVEMFAAKSINYSEEFVKRTTPQDDWLVVTVDYHS